MLKIPTISAYKGELKMRKTCKNCIHYFECSKYWRNYYQDIVVDELSIAESIAFLCIMKQLCLFAKNSNFRVLG